MPTTGVYGDVDSPVARGPRRASGAEVEVDRATITRLSPDTVWVQQGGG